MKTRKLTAIALALVLVLGTGLSVARAGLLEAIDAAMKNYANNIVKQGDQAISDVKNRQFHGAFDNYAKSFYEEGKLGGDALKDSKAIFAELKKIALWLPNKIKEWWKKFIDAIGRTRDKIGAAGPGGPPPNANGGAAAPAVAEEGSMASETGVRASAGLGDGFLGRYSAASTDAKLSTYGEYRGEYMKAERYIAGLGRAERKEFANHMAAIGEELDAMEMLLVPELTGEALENFRTTLEQSGPEMRSAYGPLVQKLGRRLKASVLGGSEGSDGDLENLQAIRDLLN